MHATTRRSGRRQAAWMLLGAAVLLMVGNALHPVDANPSATSRLDLATSATWLPVHLVAGLGMLAAGVGLARTAATMDGRHAATVRVAGWLAGTGGVALAIVFVALDGHGAATLAQRWDGASGGDRQVIEAAAVALEAIDTGLAGLGTLLLFGVGLVGVGIAALDDDQLPSWTGWIALALGTAGLVTGYVLLSRGATPTTINVLLRPTAAGSTLLLGVLGFVLLRATRPAGDGVDGSPVAIAT